MLPLVLFTPSFPLPSFADRKLLEIMLFLAVVLRFTAKPVLDVISLSIIVLCVELPVKKIPAFPSLIES